MANKTTKRVFCVLTAVFGACAALLAAAAFGVGIPALSTGVTPPTMILLGALSTGCGAISAVCLALTWRALRG